MSAQDEAVKGTSKIVAFPREVVERYRREGYWGSCTIGAELRSIALRFPDQEAVVTTERRLSFAELDARSDAMAQRLIDIGLEAGDPVIMQIGNTAETIEAFYAMIKMGAVPVCTLTPFGHHEIDAIASMVSARAHLVQADIPGRDLLVFSREVRAAVPSIEFTLSIRGDCVETDAIRLDDVACQDWSPHEARDWGVSDPDAVAVMQLSGGTTGTPKVIPRLHAEYWYNGVATAARWGLSQDDRVAHFLPIVHNAGIHGAVFAAHSVGATLVLGGSWTPTEVLETLEQERVTGFLTMTTLINTIADEPGFLAATRWLKRLSLAVPAVPGDLFDRLISGGTPVFQLFGMSEGFCASMPLDASMEMRRETVGYPMSDADEFKLLDPDGSEEVATGQPGELCVRGPYTLRGYYDSAEHNARAFTSDGYLRTGDIVRVVEIDGRSCIQVQGRSKDLISRGGEKINASEIEVLLRECPGIRDAALVAVDDQRLGERACAFVVVDPTEAESPTLEVLKNYLARRGVAKYKWPERLELIEAIPLTPVGKIAKRDLKEILSQRLEVPPTK